MRVRRVDPAVTEAQWDAGEDPSVGVDWEAYRGRVAACLDVSLDSQHVTLATATVLPDDRVLVGIAKTWTGGRATAEMRAELPALLRTMRPRVLAWFPTGPAAAIAAELVKPRGRRPSQLPRAVRVHEVRGEATAACMGLAELAKTALVAHNGDRLLRDHVTGSDKGWRGDAWVFVRKGAGHCDAAYAAAGAAYEARILPTLLPGPGVVKPSDGH